MTTDPHAFISELAHSQDPDDQAYYRAFLCAERQLKAFLKTHYEAPFHLPALTVPDEASHGYEWLLRLSPAAQFFFHAKDLTVKELFDAMERFYWYLNARARRSDAYLHWMEQALESLHEGRPKVGAKAWVTLTRLVPKISDEQKAQCLAIAKDDPALQMLIYPYFDEKTQKALLKNALEKNDPQALYRKAQTYKYGNAYWRRTMEKAAKMGDADASGDWLDYLMDTTPESPEAKAWLLACANHEAGLPVYRASQHYLDGTSPYYDLAEGLRLVERASAMGCEDAFYESGLCHVEGYLEDDGTPLKVLPATTVRRVAMGYFELVAAAMPYGSEKKRVADAAGKLAYLYMTGKFLPEDPVMVAYLGHHAAMMEKRPTSEGEEGGGYAWWVSGFYREGFVVEKDPEAEFYWQAKAAERDHPLALYNMGCNFWRGEFLPQDDEEAVIAWNRAWLKFGNELALVRLGRAFELGRGVEKDPNMAKILYTLAREKGVDEELMTILTRDQSDDAP